MRAQPFVDVDRLVDGAGGRHAVPVGQDVGGNEIDREAELVVGMLPTEFAGVTYSAEISPVDHRHRRRPTSRLTCV